MAGLHLPLIGKPRGTNIPNQAAYPPSNNKFRKAEGACGAVGSMAINSGKLNFKFQRKGADKLTACTVYPVADIEAIKGNGLILSCMSNGQAIPMDS